MCQELCEGMGGCVCLSSKLDSFSAGSSRGLGCFVLFCFGQFAVRGAPVEGEGR